MNKAYYDILDSDEEVLERLLEVIESAGMSPPKHYYSPDRGEWEPEE